MDRLLPPFARALRAVIWALGLAAAGRAGPNPESVVLVANADDPQSLAIARHYAQRRHVPPANLIALHAPTGETIGWPEFVATIWRPLEAELVARGWIDAIPMDAQDAVGRRRYAISGHRIGALIVCRGLPLRIEDDPALFQEVPPLTAHPQFRTNQGAVDSELSLLAWDNYPINACVANPLFANDRPLPAQLAQVVKVSRLDGPTADEALHLVDRAIEAEGTGLLGRAYVDIAGPHESGDRWLEAAAAEVRRLGFDLSRSQGKETLAPTARFDAPVLYFGWYTSDLNGPFALPGFRFPPGAIAVHIHSFSARTLRSAREAWCGPLVARGVTATVGNVFEPYLEFTHRPDLLMHALARGDALVDAAYFARPGLSWQSILIGDPLYHPLARALPNQLAALASLPPERAGYAVLRQMNLLVLAGRPAEATALGQAELRRDPSLAVALALAARSAAAANGDQALWTIGDAVANSPGSGPGSWALRREAAALLAAGRRYPEAMDAYRELLDLPELPPEVRRPWLSEAREVALAAGDAAQAAEWARQREGPRAP